jgi:hypothetical protein
MAQRNRTSDAVWTAFTETIRFIVIPLVLVELVTKNYPQLSTAFMPNIVEYTLFFGGMIVAASTLEVANKPGTYKRLLFGLSTLAFVALWLFVILGGGIVQFSYGPYVIWFDMSKIVMIMIAGIGLKSLLVIEVYNVNKGILERQERERQREEHMERKALAAASRKAASDAAALHSFSSMSRASYHVTADDDVGYTEPKGATAGEGETARYKTCSVCGERAPESSYVCMSCGAWFSKESFRFGKERSKKE